MADILASAATFGSRARPDVGYCIHVLPEEDFQTTASFPEQTLRLSYEVNYE
jgi:hypothetical protein